MAGGYSAGSASVQIVPDFSGAQRRIGEFFASQKDAKINVDPDLNQAHVAAMRKEIGANHAEMKVDVDFKEAAAKTRELLDMFVGFELIDPIFRKAFGPGSMLMTGGVGALTALASAAAQVGPALLTIPAAAAAAGAGLGAIAVGVMGVGKAFQALGAADASAATDAASAASKRQAAAKQVESAERGVESAERGVESAHRAVEQAERSLVDAHQAVKDAAFTLSEAHRQVTLSEFAVIAAERDLAAAQEDTRRAQEDLNVAREEATRQLADMNRELASSALDEEAAVLAVDRARERLQSTMAAGSKATELDRRQADLNYRQALQSLDDVRNRNKELAEDVDKANKKGVEGSDRVVAAKDRIASALDKEKQAARGVKDAHLAVRDANRGVDQAERGLTKAHQGVTAAERNLADAHRGVADAARAVADAEESLAEAQKAAADAANGGSEAQAKAAAAMANLSPAARDFVKQIRDLAPAWKNLRLDVQQSLFSGLGDTISHLASTSLPTLRDGLSGIAKELSGGLQTSLRVFSEPDSVKDFATLLGNIRDMWHELAKAAEPFTHAFIDITTVGSEFLPRFGRWIADIADGIASWTAKARASGALFDMINNAFTVLDQLGRIVGNLAGGIGGIFAAALPAGMQLLGFLEKFTGFLDVFLNSDPAASALGTFFDQIANTFDILEPALEAVVDALVTGLLPAMSGLMESVAPVLGSVLTQLAEMVKEIAPLIYPVFAEALVVLLNAMAPLIPVITEIAKTIFPILAEIIKELAPAFAGLAEAVGEGLVIAVKDLAPMLPPIVKVFADFLRIITPFIPYLIEFVGLLIKFVGPVLALWWAFNKLRDGLEFVLKIWKLLRIAMVVSPFGMIMVGIGLLIAGLVMLWKHSETFRTIVTKVFHAVADAGKWMWENVLKPVWEAMQTGWDYLVKGIHWAWEHILKPVFNVLKIVAAALAIFMAVVVFGPILIAWKLLTIGIKWAWENVLKPAWAKLQEAAHWMWENVLKPIWEAIKKGWNLLLKGIDWAWVHILKPVWDAVEKAAKWLWETILSPIFDAIKKGWKLMATGFKWVYDNLLKPVFDKVGELVEVLKTGFEKGVEFIGKVWAAIQDMLATPVQWVVDVVWNNGLRKLWNWISDLWGAEPLKPFVFNKPAPVKPPKTVTASSLTGGRAGDNRFAADGAVLPGWSPGRDVHHFFSPTGGQLHLSGGEAVMRPEFTRVLGEANINLLNRLARTQGEAGLRQALGGGRGYANGGVIGQSFAKGGVVDPPTWAKAIISAVSPIGMAVIQKYIDQANRGEGLGEGGWASSLAGMVTKTGKKFWDQLSDWWNDEGQFADKTDDYGVPTAGSSGQAANQAIVKKLAALRGWGEGVEWNALYNLIMGESGFNSNAQNPTSTAYGMFQFLDSTWAGYGYPKSSDPSTQTKAGLNYIAARYGDPLRAWNTWNSRNPHWYAKGGVLPTYDAGGWLPPGISTVYNGTGRPEPVLTAAEHDALMRGGRVGGGRDDGRSIMGDVNIFAQQDRASEIVDELWHRMRVASRGGVYGAMQGAGL